MPTHLPFYDESLPVHEEPHLSMVSAYLSMVNAYLPVYDESLPVHEEPHLSMVRSHTYEESW